MAFRGTSAFLELLEPRRLLSVGYGWGVGGGCSGKAKASAVLTDTDGSVYVLGEFSGSMDVDPSKKQVMLTASGSSDLFVIKYSVDRKLLWAREVGGPAGQMFPTAMSLDPNGGLVLVGSFSGTVNLGSGPVTSAGGEDCFILQVTADTGQTQESTAFGGPYYDAIRSVDASSGYPYVAGVFTKSIHFPQTNGVVKSAGGQDGFVLRYIYDADVNGYMTIGGSGNDAINQIVRDPTTNQLSIVGTMEAKASFGPSATPDKNGKFQPVYLNSHGGKDAFYARYTAGFKNLFAQRYGGNGDDYGQALAIGSSGAYIAGTFSKPMNGLTSIGGSDVFVKQINGGIYDIGSVANDAVGKLAIDSTGRLIVTGTYGASMTFNNIPLLDQGKSDVFVATFDRTFAPETIVGLGGQYTDTTTGLATGPDGAVCVVGSFQRWFDLGPGDISALIYGNVNGEFYLDRLIIE